MNSIVFNDQGGIDPTQTPTATLCKGEETSTMIGTQSEKSRGQILEHNNNSSSSRDIEENGQSGSSTPSGATTPPPKPVLPEGGLQGWLAVLACWCILFNTFGYINAFGYVLSC